MKLIILFCLLTSSVFAQSMTLTGLAPSSGATSSAVTLNGTGLGNTINVFFGTSASAISSISSTQIIVTVPSSLGGGSYQVYASTGIIRSNSLPFFVGNTFTPTNTPTGSPTPTFTPTYTPTATYYVLVNQNAGVNGNGQIVGVSPTWTPNYLSPTPLPTVFINNQSAVQLGSGQIVVSPTWTPIVPAAYIPPVATPYYSSGTVTILANVLYAEAFLVGGGAAGWGSGTSQGTSPGAGSNSVLALSSPVTAFGGQIAGSFNALTGGQGGSFTIGSTAYGMGVTGGMGGGSFYDGTLSAFAGSLGGSSALSGAGNGGNGGYTNGTSQNSGPGGGAGGFVHVFWIPTPGATITITIGGPGNGGGAGGGGIAGSAGVTGVGFVIQHYN